MSIILQPKSYSEAYDMLVSLPFYTLKDFWLKAPVVFEESEILSVKKHNGNFVVYYHRKDFHGHLNCKHFNNELFLKYSQKPAPKDSFFLFLRETIFSFYTPANWIVLYVITVGYLFIEHGNVFFEGISRPELYVSARCGIQCIKNISWALNALSMILALTVGSLLLSLLFFFVISKKTKSARLFNCIRLEAFLIFAVNIAIAHQIVAISLKENNYKNLWTIYKIVYQPDKVEKFIYRKTASELTKKTLIDK